MSRERKSLFHSHPNLAMEILPSLNQGLTAMDVTFGSSKTVTWKCVTISSSPCGHQWKTTVYSRSNGTGCPYCSGRAVHIDGRNSMLTTHPKLAKELHPTLNPGVSSRNVIAGTNKQLVWICEEISSKPCSHIWKSRGNKRVRGRGCPSCSGLAVHSSGKDSLAVTHPKISIEFHPELNGDLTPKDLKFGSNKIIYWKCSTLSTTPCNHVWRTTVAKRASVGRGCPSCAGNVVHSDGRNSLSSTYSLLAQELHQSLNPKEVGRGIKPNYTKKLFWICKTISRNPCGHIWETTPNSRVSGKSGCPACAGNAVHIDGRNSMEKTHPELAKEFDLELNDGLNPLEITASTNQVLHWKCVSLSPNPCGFKWEMTGGHRAQGRGCPSCAVYGFDVNSEGYYYSILVSSNNGEVLFFKGGITSDLNRRMNQHLLKFANNDISCNWKLELVKSRFFTNGNDAKTLEKNLLASQIRSPNIPRVSSELFSEDPLDFALAKGWID